MEKNRIKDLREDNFYTQEYVASKLQINRYVYAKYESGIRNAPLDILIKIASLYGVSIDYLCGISDDRTLKEYKNVFNYKKLTNNIVNIRKEFGYTQQDLSEKISVMQSTISKYEIGLIGIPIDFLISLSLLYNKSLGSLMGLED